MIPREFYWRPKYQETPLTAEDLQNKDEISILGKSKIDKGLSGRTKIKRLWVFGVNDKQLEKILSLLLPEELILQDCRVKDLRILESLDSLTTLLIHDNTKTERLWDISKNTQLTTLHLENFPKITSIAEVTDSNSIVKLAIEGSMWTNWKFDTLSDFGTMTQLKFLRLMCIKVADGSLFPLTRLTNLEELDLAYNFETREFARLSVYLTGTRCDRFSPFRVSKCYANGILTHDIEITGIRKPDLHSERDKDKVAKICSAI